MVDPREKTLVPLNISSRHLKIYIKKSTEITDPLKTRINAPITRFNLESVLEESVMPIPCYKAGLWKFDTKRNEN